MPRLVVEAKVFSLPKFKMKAIGFGKPSLFLPQYPVFLIHALVEPKLVFPAMDLKQSFKSIAAYGFF